MSDEQFSQYRADGSPVVTLGTTGDLSAYREDGSVVVHLGGTPTSGQVLAGADASGFVAVAVRLGADASAGVARKATLESEWTLTCSWLALLPVDVAATRPAMVWLQPETAGDVNTAVRLPAEAQGTIHSVWLQAESAAPITVRGLLTAEGDSESTHVLVQLFGETEATASPRAVSYLGVESAQSPHAPLCAPVDGAAAVNSHGSMPADSSGLAQAPMLGQAETLGRRAALSRVQADATGRDLAALLLEFTAEARFDGSFIIDWNVGVEPLAPLSLEWDVADAIAPLRLAFAVVDTGLERAFTGEGVAVPANRDIQRPVAQVT